MYRGSCLCGTVRYEINASFSDVSHCHCSMCRKAHGAAYGSYGNVRRGEFQFLSGESSIVAYQSSPGVVRTFCGRCGATLQWYRTNPPSEQVSFALGTLDTPYVPTSRPKHIYVASRAPWVDVCADWELHD